MVDERIDETALAIVTFVAVAVFLGYIVINDAKLKERVCSQIARFLDITERGLDSLERAINAFSFYVPERTDRLDLSDIERQWDTVMRNR